MSKINKRIVIKLIKYNDYDELDRLLNENPDYNVSYTELLFSINRLSYKCFILLLNRCNKINVDPCCYIYRDAFKIYFNSKNVENKIFISELLKKSINIPLYTDIIIYLYKYDLEIFNKYIELKINEYVQNVQFKHLLGCLLNPITFTYFLEFFNKLPANITKTSFVKDYVYGYNKRYYIYFDNFINEYDYNKLVLINDGTLLNQNLLNRILNGFFPLKLIKSYIRYLENNPVDFSSINEYTPIFLYPHKRNMLNSVKILKLLKKPIVINFPKINLIAAYKRYYVDDYKYIILLYYILYKCGIQYDIYGGLNAEEFKKKIINNDINKAIIEIIRFGKFINQDLPNEYRNIINENCDDNLVALVDVPITKKYIDGLKNFVKDIY